MNILGFSCYFHDSAACLVQNGQIIAAAEEERFSRVKHDFGFPSRSIKYCLEQANLSIDDIDGIAFYEKPALKLERSLSVAAWHPDSDKRLIQDQIAHFLEESLSLEEKLEEETGYKGQVYYLEHHLSHAASAFLPSPFERAAILTLDGSGEWTTTSQFIGEGNTVKALREIHFPHSLGLFYATLTNFLGFEVNEGEYKVMGLASYGKPTYQDEMDKLIKLREDGSFELSLEYFAYTKTNRRMFSDEMSELLGPARQPEEAITERHQNIAASMQYKVEQAVLNLARSARDITGCKNLCLAGGVAHNVVANTGILEAKIFDNIFVQPSSGDSGAAIGAALYLDQQLSESKREPMSQYNTLLGPQYSEQEIQKALDKFDVEFEHLGSEQELCEEVASLIADDFIIGWHQGRMEFGPRALGSRSILANPCNPDMKNILNASVKRREEFRPFAPAVLAEKASDYFVMDHNSPFMLFTPQVQPQKTSDLPAITHVDGSARVQTVSHQSNPLFHKLIEAFEKITGVPVLINTSFNIRGEPIVCTPEDAIRCFQGTDIDFLVLGPFLVRK